MLYNKVTMAKQKKKRNKKYTGADAAMTRPTVTRVQAVSRGRVSQWWFDHKRLAKPILIATAVILVVVWLIVELVRVITNA